jgi:GntR family transcriptional regulator
MPDGDDRTLTSKQIADVLRRRIEDGDLPPGARVPPVRELMEAYHVSTHTAQRAHQALAKDGLIVIGAGSRGSTVRRPPEMTEVPGGELLGGSNRPVDRTRLGEVGPTGAPEFVAERLKVERGAVVVVRRRAMVNRASGVPNMLVASFFPADVALGTPLAERVLLEGGSAGELQRLGFEPKPAEEWVYARMPTTGEVEALNLRSAFPVLRVVRLVLNRDGRPLEALELVMSAERHVMRYEF